MELDYDDCVIVMASLEKTKAHFEYKMSTMGFMFSPNKEKQVAVYTLGKVNRLLERFEEVLEGNEDEI
jgi:hypothetical protein